MIWMTDGMLTRRTLSGDRRAFEQLHQRHGPRVFHLLRRLTGGNTAESEDLTQETFLAAFQSLGDWRGQGAFSTWLCGIAYRRWWTSRRHRLDCDPLDDDTPVAAPNADPLAQLSRKEAEAALEKAIGELPEHYRVVYVLIRAEGMKYREVADLLEIPIGTVQSRLGKATQLLYASLAPLLVDAGTDPKGVYNVSRNV